MARTLLRALALLLMALPLSLSGQETLEDAFHKTQNDSFAAGRYKGIEIINQHGPVSVSAWDEDSIHVDIQISVLAPGEEMSQEMLDKISILTSQKEQHLVYQTILGQDFFFNYPFSIRYQVYIPARKSVKIKNRFGDVTLALLFGQLEVALDYGRLKQTGNEFVESLSAQLTFADATLFNISSADIEVSNSQVDINKGGDIAFSGDFCQINLGDADKLTIHASTGRFNIGKVNHLVIKGDYLYPSIGEITSTGNIEISNGLAIIKKVSDRLEALTISNNHTPLSLNLQQSLNYTLNGEVENGRFRHYRAQQFKIIDDQNTISFSGTNGALDNSASIVIFNRDADVNIYP